MHNSPHVGEKNYTTRRSVPGESHEARRGVRQSDEVSTTSGVASALVAVQPWGRANQLGAKWDIEPNVNVTVVHAQPTRLQDPKRDLNAHARARLISSEGFAATQELRVCRIEELLLCERYHQPLT
eukprot:CAMPEP_0182812160 /NCGR_PEP_ID=MMETSP0006_2-20121128/8659_1 /TAXON_ID=97485 /ORGANISM="Prymnesium parvum, Strain Texoma1" /LENGTH=125 /DNA_ID=CAMNT_0024938173 /DNA_START=334 /DNA_END=712 /DNA_ORIENTATION=-